MSDLDFYAHFATRGDVLGLGVGAQPAEWAERLGADYVDDVDGALMRRDYGLVELSFQEAEGSWPCFGISVQVHRLRWDAESAVPTALRSSYGAFASPVRFEDLTAAIDDLGCSVEPDDDATATDFRRYRVPESGARLIVRMDVDAQGLTGDLWSLSVSPAWWRETG
ncbi:hypothetical protein ACFUJR_29475 [Streptomyces sp. NPDC057271]|uniref:hypothetical protein n=1 Tax=unclassified Streptomyces TaxID=2593676 RepID=UPI00363DA478